MLDPAALHASLLTIDTHIDIPWPTGPDPFESSARQLEFPKMQAGHLRAVCLAAYVPQGPRTPEGRAAATARAHAMLDHIVGLGRTQNGLVVRIASTADAIEAAQRDGVLAVIPVVENGYAIGEDLGVLEQFRAKGVRYMTLTHNGHNDLCDSSNPRTDLHDAETLHEGLSELGRAAIQEMNRLGILIDISHVSKQAALQAAMLSRTPVIATHSCVKALCDVRRNLDDQTLDALRDCEGMVSLTAVPSFVRPGGKVDGVTVADFADHVEYVVKRIGLAHVGIGSDFDGGGGVTGWRNASESANVTAELVRRGYGPAELTQLWGGNVMRLLRRAEAFSDRASAGAA